MQCPATTDVSSWCSHVNYSKSQSYDPSIQHTAIHAWDPKAKVIFHWSQKVNIHFCWNMYGVDVKSHQKPADPFEVGVYI
jgi:hypothetical protein